MPDRMRISEEVVVGAQPSEAELKAMAEDGYQSVINLRTEGEKMQPMSPAEEGEKVRGYGMQYLHIPVSGEQMNDEQVDRFRQELERLPKPAFVHCELGKRSGAFVMMDLATRQGMTGDQLLEKAMDMGFKCDNQDLMQFVKDYIDAHRHESAA